MDGNGRVCIRQRMEIRVSIKGGLEIRGKIDGALRILDLTFYMVSAY